MNIFSQSMEATEGLKMQRQSFDFQLTELPISPALISHALPLRPSVLKVKALTLSPPTARLSDLAIQNQTSCKSNVTILSWQEKVKMKDFDSFYCLNSKQICMKTAKY
ncbi:hypothetical protein ATANTOWER_017471 [Ataeniobius toweri]|uniref:Uncharacterized protein n=1 Tax=Ataeniobius toweri TaxID=208326 RepID=A0ABU7CC21_9TELE|nr:hypothetical protein [Ataeniobius toweri]